MIIYTSITNNYCELPSIEDQGHTYICFTDGSIKPQKPWKFREINCDSTDPIIQSRHPKINPHLYFDEPSVWIDASRLHLLNDDFYRISEKLLSRNDAFILTHPEEHSYTEECFEYYLRSWVDEEKIFKLTKELKKFDYDFENHKTIFGCIMWRNNTEKIKEWSKKWWEFYNICGPRDQLAGSAALKITHSDVEVDMSHPAEIITQFCFYRDFWDNIGTTGQYNNGKEQLEWKEFRSDIKELTGQENINLNKLSYLADIGYQDTFNEMLNSVDSGMGYSTDVSETYNLHEAFLTKTRGDHDFIVYSCITNNYDRIPPNNYYDPKVKYVMFHDGSLDEYPEPWEYRDVRKLSKETCPRRLSAFPKINPHKCFEVGENTVWIDACYTLTKEFADESRKMFPLDLATMEHCYNFTYYDEMLEGFLCSFYSYEQGIDLTKQLFEAGYNFKEYISPCCTMIWRTVRSTTSFRKFCDEWWKWSLIGSNRDQISFDAARQFSGLKIFRVHNKPPETLVKGIELRFTEKNKNRKGKHPRRGTFDQWRQRDQFLTDMQQYAKLSPKIYATHEHISMLEFNDLLPPDVMQEYLMSSPTMRNLKRQQQLWSKDMKRIRDAVWSKSDQTNASGTKEEQTDEWKRRQKREILLQKRRFTRDLKSTKE